MIINFMFPSKKTNTTNNTNLQNKNQTKTETKTKIPGPILENTGEGAH
jgi:hypothetical protein